MIVSPNGQSDDRPVEPAALTDLGELLFGPDGEAEMARVRARLLHLRQTLESELGAGTARDRFEALTALREAVDSADAVMVDISKITRSKPEAGAL